jgi:hemolysin activation/secretion protein
MDVSSIGLLKILLYRVAIMHISSQAKFMTLLLLSGASFVAASASAAPVAPVPASVEPGRFEQRFKMGERPAVERGAVVKEEVQAPVGDASDGVAFTLKAVRVTGATAFSSESLQALFSDSVGKQVTLGGLREIANKVTAQYRNAGYILSKAVIPPQRISEGVVVIEVVEGSVDNVVFQGAEKQNMSLLNSYADKIKASKPLKNSDLERYLLLVDDLTGVTARGVLSASPSSKGSSTLTVALDHKTIEGNVTVDNRGGRYLGPWEAGLTVAENSALGLSEQIRGRVLSSTDMQELHYYEGSYQQPVGSEGSVVRVLSSYTDSEPGSSLKAFEIKGKSLAFSAEVQHPIKRSRQENVYAGAGFRYRDAKTDALSVQLYEDNIRSVYANVAYDTLDAIDGVNRVDAEVAQGITVLGANHNGDPTSRTNGENVFTKLSGQASHLQPLGNYFSWFVSASGQAASDALLASEEFTVGGVGFGSAYDSAEISGDHGFAARTEVRFSDSLPESYGSMYQLYVFYDGGKVYNKDTLASEKKSESLVSTGVGARLSLAHDIYATAEVAKPLTREVAAEGDDGDNIRSFVSLTYSY